MTRNTLLTAAAIIFLSSSAFAEYGTNAERGYDTGGNPTGNSANTSAAGSGNSWSERNDRNTRYDPNNSRVNKQINNSIDRNADQRDSNRGGNSFGGSGMSKASCGTKC